MYLETRRKGVKSKRAQAEVLGLRSWKGHERHLVVLVLG